MIFLQRQIYLQPFTKASTDLCKKIILKLLFLLYLSVVGTPIIMYVISVMFVTVKRDLSIALSILMVSMIHPIISLTFGLSIKCVRQFISNFWPKRYKIKSTIWKRLMTFSINVYLALIGIIIYYLILMDFCQWKEYDYMDQSYDKCLCDELISRGQKCKNEDDDFQNYLKDFTVENFILAFSSVSLACHIIHSLTIAIPPPIPMIDFILGSSKKATNQENICAIELEKKTEPVPPQVIFTEKETKSKIGWSWSMCFKVFCFFISIAFIGSVIASPLFVKSIGQCPTTNENDTCQTTENKYCKFPFMHNNEIYHGCSTVDRDGDSSNNKNDVAWCATDANKYGKYNSFGNCRDNCPGGNNCP